MATKLTERQMKLLTLFKDAIEREREAQEAFEGMLSIADDPTLRSILESFVRQEKEHEEILMKKYAELKDTTEFGDVS